MQTLDSCAGDEEPLVIYPVNWGWGVVFVSFDVARTRVFAIRRMLDGDISARIWSVASFAPHWDTHFSQRNPSALSFTRN